MNPPWLEEALGGVYVLRGADLDTAKATVEAAFKDWPGPNIGSLDFLPPNELSEAFLVLERWTDCFEPEVQGAARLVLERLELASRMRGVEVLPWYAYAARVLVPAIAPEDEARVVAEVFPRLPGWVGMHMGAPHWLGVGMAKEGDAIRQLTPYVRFDLARAISPGHDGLAITGLAPRADFQAWLAAFAAGTHWL